MEKKTGKTLHRIAAVGLAGVVLWCGGMQTEAATLKDVFDEHYYADTYPDLKASFGYDREALWNHFVEYGLNESRGMSGLIDVVKYRKEYADLNAVFGNNWDAYVNHYLTFGAKEGRDTGTEFNAHDYAARYSDLQAAFGNNVLALWKHYQTAGSQEGREARSEEVVEAEIAAAEAEEEMEQKPQETQKPEETQKPQETQKPEETQKPQETQKPEETQKPQETQKPDASGEYTKRVDTSNGFYWMYTYNAAHEQIKGTYYNDKGEVRMHYTYEYENGKMVRSTQYDKEGGSVQSSFIYKYEDGRIKVYGYDSKGTLINLNEYDENDVEMKTRLKYTSYDEDGKINQISENGTWSYYTYNNGVLTKITDKIGTGPNAKTKKVTYYKDGKPEYYDAYTYDSNGKATIKSYNMDGSVRN